MRRNDPNHRHLAVFGACWRVLAPVLFAPWLTTGCTAVAGSNAELAQPASANDSGNGGKAQTPAADASGSLAYAKDAGGGSYASAADAATSAGPSGAGDQSIGLKPGGAQDIGFFRLLLQQGKLPKPGDMAMEGWLNEHDTVLPPAQKDRLVSLHALAAVIQPKGEPAQGVLQLGLNSAKKLADVQTSLSLTLVIDNSGSMSGEKLAFVKLGLHELADNLPKGTRLTIYTFSENAVLIWPAKIVAASDLPALHGAIEAVQATQGTNLYAGLEAGLADCEGVGAEFVQKRIMLLSDGAPTVGNTSEPAIIALAGKSAAAGCSVSTVGVGLDFSPLLMTGIAQQGQGTGWFLQDATAAKTVFVQDLETLLVAVAQKLWLQFKPAAGWKVVEIYGFEWVETAGLVQITGPKKAPPQPGQPADPPPVTDPNAPQVAMPTLFASARNGLVLARLVGPASTEPLQVQNLDFAAMTYGYIGSKDQKAEQFTVPVVVPGLAAVPDGGLVYFADPGVRRAWLLMMDGQALIAAVQLAADGKPAEAQGILAAALARHGDQVAAMQADLAVYDATAPDLEDAKGLLTKLAALIAK